MINPVTVTVPREGNRPRTKPSLRVVAGIRVPGPGRTLQGSGFKLVSESGRSTLGRRDPSRTGRPGGMTIRQNARIKSSVGAAFNPCCALAELRLLVAKV